MRRAFKEIAAKQLDMYIYSDDIQIIDVRGKAEFAAKHIEGAENVPIDELTAGANKFSRDKILLLYCDRGGNSYIAARHLSKQGYNVIVVVGGLNAYRGNHIIRNMP